MREAMSACLENRVFESLMGIGTFVPYPAKEACLSSLATNSQLLPVFV